MTESEALEPKGWDNWNGHDVVDASEVFGSSTMLQEGDPGFACDWACRRCHLAVGDMETGQFDEKTCSGVVATVGCDPPRYSVRR